MPNLVFTACCNDCRERGCIDCISTAVIDDTAGCCHSAPEQLLFTIWRPAWSQTFHSFGSNPGGDPVECPGGCELSVILTYPEMDPMWFIYDYESFYFKCDYDAKEDRTERTPCGEVCIDCCPDTFPAYVGCVCDPEAHLSTHQYDEMSISPQFQWLIDIICYGGGTLDCFPPIRDLDTCEDTVSDTTLYQQLLCVVHPEHWWILSSCDGAVSDIHVPNDPDTPLQYDCIAPKRFLFACSGCPLFDFDLRFAVQMEVLTTDEECDALVAIGNGVTVAQAILKKLSDANITSIKDHRPDIVAAMAVLIAAFPLLYADCDALTCETLAPVGPIRKIWPECLDRADVETITESLQPDLDACWLIDPFAGVYPETSADPLWEAYKAWLLVAKAVFFHARPGGGSWICAEPGAPDSAAPDIPRETSVDENCPDTCIDVSGYPQDFSCADGAYDGVNPDTGLATCEVGCESIGDPGFTNEFGCLFLDVACGDAIDGSKCINVTLTGTCDGLHFHYTQFALRRHAVDASHPAGLEFYLLRENYATLIGLNCGCGEWDSELCFSCHPITRIEVSDDLGSIEDAYLAILGFCNQIVLGSGDAVPCGGYCLDLGDGCTHVNVGGACDPPASDVPDNACIN